MSIPATVRATVLPRLVARVTGDDPLAFLHAVLSKDLTALAAGRATLACYLDVKALVLAEIRVMHLPDGSILIDAEPAARAAFDQLSRIAPLSDCQLDESEGWGFTAVRGEMSEPTDGEVAAIRDGCLVGVRWGGSGYDMLAVSRPPRGARTTIEEFEAARISAGRPRFGIDITPEMFVFETPLLQRAVSLNKGCYPGQESVARTVNLGRPRRRLAHIVFDAVAPDAIAPDAVAPDAAASDAGAPDAGAPRAGTAVRADGKEVGRVTSAAAEVAIALISTEVSDGAHVEAAGIQGQVKPLPDAYP